MMEVEQFDTNPYLGHLVEVRGGASGSTPRRTAPAVT